MSGRAQIPHDSVLAAAIRRQLEMTASPANFESLPTNMRGAIERIIQAGSGPDLGIVPAILERRVLLPEVPAGALQGGDGYDARTWANARIYPVLAWLKDATGGKVKLSKDAGVSNPYRERIVDAAWLARRKPDQRYRDLLEVVEVLGAVDDATAGLCLEYAASQLIARFRSSQLTYRVPLRISRAEATRVIDGYVGGASSGGRRLECVIAALVRTTLARTWPTAEVVHSDPNDPDMCDVVVRDGGEERLLVEVTDSDLTVAKLREEVVERLHQSKTASHAIIVTPRFAAYEENELSAYIEKLFAEAGLTVSVLAPTEAIYGWMALYGDEHVQLQLLEAIGEEVDQFGVLSDRQGWRDALGAYWDRATGVAG